MFKKLVLSFMATSLVLVVGVQAFAQKSDEAILNVFSEELISPLKFDVNTNDTLNLRVNNKSNKDVKFEVPMMDISVEIDKNSKVVVPISFTNPADKDIWFIIKMAGVSNNNTGKFKVLDYKVYQPTSDVDRIDTSVLKDIINYNTSFYYEDKPEPVYNTTSYDSYKPVEEPVYSEPAPAPAKTGGYVRGYW